MSKAAGSLVALALLAALGVARPATALTTGGAAPGFALKSASGKTVGLSELRGQVVLINFWATWCGPCRTEMPILEQLYKKYRPLGVTLLGVNVEPDSAGALAWIKATPVSFPILFDSDSTVSKLYDVQGMPSTVIVDRSGRVRYQHRGYQSGAENDYLDQIRTLIREK